MEASVLPKVTDDLPTVPVSPVLRWKHLSDLELADPNFRVPAAGVDILLGAKVFSKAFLHGQQYSPNGAPSAFKTFFSWVLNGEVNDETRHLQSHNCGIALANSQGVYKGPSGRVPLAKKSKNRRVFGRRYVGARLRGQNGTMMINL